jgi:hypothetical protein
MDSVQFALALEKYDVTVHQPHPPGYFLYVMLGRLFNLFFHDANTAFVAISIIFSGLTVVTVYYLGRDMFDDNTGLIAAVIAITSPNLWFHGEVALTYVVEAFFSTLVAWLCWRIDKGEHRYIWLSALVLGIAGGVRQNTTVFLLPLWAYSLKGLSHRQVTGAYGLLSLTCLAWFIPMIEMTGGWYAYTAAFKELWTFNTGNVSVFSGGWSSFQIFSLALLQFTVVGLAGGVFVIVIAGYSLMRRRKLNILDRQKEIFFFLWISPSVIFYLLIFIHPANPGYVLIFLPALYLIAAASVVFICQEVKDLFGRKILVPLLAGLLVFNTCIFMNLSHPMSYLLIREHDKDLARMLRAMSEFSPGETAIFVNTNLFFGYRQIMYYLPEFLVYRIDSGKSDNGEKRKIFWGTRRSTYLTDGIVLPESVINFVTPIMQDNEDLVSTNVGITLEAVKDTKIFLASGRMPFIRGIFGDLELAIPAPAARDFHL